MAKEKKAKKKSSFWADFKKFITRGNVIDMAVGVVVGGAFSKIVTGLVNYIINPFIGIFMKQGSLDDVKTIITPEIVDETTKEVVQKEVAILWGTWLQTILDFIIVALCIFLVVRIITGVRNKLEEKKKEEEAAAKAEADAKAAKEKEIADEAAAAAAAVAAEKQAKLEAAVLNQEKLLGEICELLKNK